MSTARADRRLSVFGRFTKVGSGSQYFVKRGKRPAVRRPQQPLCLFVLSL